MNGEKENRLSKRGEGIMSEESALKLFYIGLLIVAIGVLKSVLGT